MKTSREIFMPCGDDIALLLGQPQITGADIKSILKKRGVLTDSSDKTEIVEHLVYSYLTSAEVEELLQIISDREENLKIQSCRYEIQLKDGVNFSQVIPSISELKFNETAKDPTNNYKVKNAGVFKKDGENSYSLDYSLVRNQVASTWVKSQAEFDGRIVLKHIPDESKMEIRLFHSSSETKGVNSLCKKRIVQVCESKSVLSSKSEESIKYKDFNNEERVLFFNKFTSAFDGENFSFSKLGDLSYGVDDDNTPESEQRLSWMKKKVSKSTVSGDGIYDTFIFKERDCWKYLRMWMLELKFEVQTASFKGSTKVRLEFEGYSRNSKSSARFSISADPIKASKYDGGTEKARSAMLEKLNGYARKFAQEILIDNSKNSV